MMKPRSQPIRHTVRPPDFDPEAQRPALAAGAQALGVSLDAGQLARLLQFAVLLQKWNAVHNVTSITSPDKVVTHHLLDSLAAAPAVQDRAGHRVLDVGSGGGLPGIPLAIALPDHQFTLVDTVQKKCAFLTQAALELGLRNLTVRHARVERLTGEYDLIVSRAFAAAGEFVRLTAHLLAPEGCWLAMKGRADAGELAGLPSTVVATRLPLTVPGLDGARHLLEIRPR